MGMSGYLWVGLGTSGYVRNEAKPIGTTRTPAQQNLEKIGKNPKPRTKSFFSQLWNLEVPKLVWGPNYLLATIYR